MVVRARSLRRKPSESVRMVFLSIGFDGASASGVRGWLKKAKCLVGFVSVYVVISSLCVLVYLI